MPGGLGHVPIARLDPAARRVRCRRRLRHQLFGIYDRIGKPIAAARADERDRSVPLKLGVKDTSYRMPLADKSLSDEARVRIVLKGVPPAPER